MNYHTSGKQAHGISALAQELPKYGRYNDDMVAHISSDEARLLKSLGGSGTINPTTGLPEFGMFGIGGGGGILGTGINKGASDPVSNALSNNPISKGVSKGFQGAMGAVDQGLVGLDKAIGKAIPGGWGTLGSIAANFIPVVGPALSVGLGALNGSGVMHKGGSFNLQGAMIGGALAYGAGQLASGLEAAGGASDAVANAAGSAAPGAATAEGIAKLASNIDPSVLESMTAQQVANSALQSTDTAALNALTKGMEAGAGAGLQVAPPPSVMSQFLSGNVGDAFNQIGQNIGSGITSAGNALDKATSLSTYEELAKGTGQNIANAGKGIANLTGMGSEGFSGIAPAAKAFSASGATMSNTALPIATGVMGLQAMDEQRKALQEQLAAGNIDQQNYDAQMAEIDRQYNLANKAVAEHPFSTTPNRTPTMSDNLYETALADKSLYDRETSGSSRLYAMGGDVDAESGSDDNYADGGLGTLSTGVHFAKGGMPRFLSGGGDGMSDSIKASIEGKQEARLADGEFVIPADVVSHLGNGSSKAGAKQLYSMMNKVRKARTGSAKQGRQINPNKLMPA